MNAKYFTRRWALRTILGIGLASTLPLPVLAGPQASGTNSPIRSVLVQVRRKMGVPAIAAALITPYAITADAIGVRRIDRPDAVTLEDRFQLGSCSKSMMATLAGVLVEQGKLRWDTTVSESFPEFAAQIHPMLQGITLTQLLAHRSGLATYDGGSELLSLSQFTGKPRQQRYNFAQYLLAQPPAFPIGTWHYSNAGYAIAGAMIEQAANDTYEYLLKSLVMQPLGSYVTFLFPGYSQPDQPWGHYETTNGLLPMDPDDYADAATLEQEGAELPAGAPIWELPDFSAVYNLLQHASASNVPGGVTLSAGGFGRYVQMHLRGLLGMQTLVSPATMAILHQPIGPPTLGTNEYYALGWIKTTINGVPTWWHDGSFDPFYALMVLQPSRGIAALCMINSGPNQSAYAAVAVIEQLMGIPNLQKAVLPGSNGKAGQRRRPF